MSRALFALALMAGLLLPAIAAERWHMPTPYPEGVHHTRNIRLFAEEVKHATDGELEIVVHSGASLFKHAQIHRAVRSDQVPLGELLMSVLGNNNPLFEIDNIPFLVTDFESAYRLYMASRPEMEHALGTEGLMLLYAVPWPPQGLYTRSAVESVSDLRGRKLRAYSPMTAELAERLEATPVNVPAPEIPQAFSSGLVKAMFTSPSTGVSSQAWDYVDYYTDTRAWIPKNMVIVNKRAFLRLPVDQQQVVLDAAAAAERRGWQMAREETLSATQVLRERGIKVVDPGDKLQRELRLIGERMASKWRREAGEDGERVLDRYRIPKG